MPGFRRKHSRVGDVAGTNQPPVPQVSLSLPRLTRQALPPCQSAHKRRKDKNAGQDAPYISVLIL